MNDEAVRRIEIFENVFNKLSSMCQSITIEISKNTINGLPTAPHDNLFEDVQSGETVYIFVKDYVNGFYNIEYHTKNTARKEEKLRTFCLINYIDKGKLYFGKVTHDRKVAS
jgi:hypothetical protein